MRTRRTTLLMTMLALMLGRAGVGQIIYDNGGPAHVSGVEMTTTIQAEQFVLSSAANLTGIHFWDIDDLAAFNGSIVWTIYSDGGLQPAAILFRGTATPTRTHTGIVVAGLDEFQNDFDIPSLSLSAGTYWLGLHNGPLTTFIPPHFFWEDTNPNATPLGNEDPFPFDDGVWQGGFQERAFFLTTGHAAAVPEPWIPGMLAATAASILLVRRPRPRSRFFARSARPRATGKLGEIRDVARHAGGVRPAGEAGSEQMSTHAA